MLAFPSQEFGGQELKSDAAVLDFSMLIAQKLVKEDYYTATGYWFKPYTFNEDDSPKAEEPAKPVESAAAEG